MNRRNHFGRPLGLLELLSSRVAAFNRTSSTFFFCTNAASLTLNLPSKFMDGCMDQVQIICPAVVVNCPASPVKIAHATRRHCCRRKEATEGGEWRLIALSQHTLLLRHCGEGLVSFSSLNRMQFTIILLKVRRGCWLRSAPLGG